MSEAGLGLVAAVGRATSIAPVGSIESISSLQGGSFSGQGQSALLQ